LGVSTKRQLAPPLTVATSRDAQGLIAAQLTPPRTRPEVADMKLAAAAWKPAPTAAAEPGFRPHAVEAAVRGARVGGELNAHEEPAGCRGRRTADFPRCWHRGGQQAGHRGDDTGPVRAG
jgi:hypothetical protein